MKVLSANMTVSYRYAIVTCYISLDQSSWVCGHCWKHFHWYASWQMHNLICPLISVVWRLGELPRRHVLLNNSFDLIDFRWEVPELRNSFILSSNSVISIVTESNLVEFYGQKSVQVDVENPIETCCSVRDGK